MRTTLAILLLCLTATAQDLAEMARHVRDYRTKFELIAIGRPAVKHLLPLTCDEDPWLAFEAQSAVRWIANRAKDKKGLAHELVIYCAAKRPCDTRVLIAELLGELKEPTTIGMLSAMVSGEEPVALAAVESLELFPGPDATKALMDSIEGRPAKIRSEIYRALGRRKDELAMPLLLDAAKGGNMSAVAALGDAGFAGAVPLLTELAKKGSKTAFLALLEVPVPVVAYGLAENDAQRLMVLRSVRRRGALFDSDLLTEAAKNPKLRNDAHHLMLDLIDKMGDGDVGDILEVATDPAVIVRALTISGGETLDDYAFAKRYLSSEHANIRTTAIAIVRDSESAGATEILVKALDKEPDPSTQKMLLEALGRRGDLAGAAALEAWMKPGEGMQELRDAAIRSYVRIADKCGDEQARRMYLTALEAGATTRALIGLSNVGDLSTLPVIEKILKESEGELRDVALDAVLAIGERLQAMGRRDDAVRAYKSALAAGAMVENRLRLLGEPVEIVARGGRVDAWWIAGPFPAPTQADWTREEFPEKGIDLKSGKFRPVQSGGSDAIVNLDALFAKNELVTAYAYAEILAKKERDAAIKTGSDDGIRIWLNGELIHSNLVLRGLTVDEDTVAVHLNEGWNKILVKVCEKGGGWNFHLRLVDAKGRPLKFRIR